MKNITIIILLFLSINTFASQETYLENNNGELVILGKIYSDILNSSTYLSEFMGEIALEYENTNSRHTYFTFDSKNKDRIDCIYNESRNSFNGFSNRNAVCGLNITIESAIDNHSNIINEVSNNESSFSLHRNSNGEMLKKQDLSLNIYKDKGYIIDIKYNSLDEYINAKPSIIIKNKNKKLLTSTNYFVVYQKLNDTYKINHILYDNNGYKKFKIQNSKFTDKILFSCHFNNKKYASIINNNKFNYYIYGKNDVIELKYPTLNEKPITWDNKKKAISFNKKAFKYSIAQDKENNYSLSVKKNNDIIFQKSCDNVSTPFPSNISQYFL